MIHSIHVSAIKTFAMQNKTFCILTLGLAIVGLSFSILGKRTVAWIYQALGTTKKTDSIAMENLQQRSPKANSKRPTNQNKPAASFFQVENDNPTKNLVANNPPIASAESSTLSHPFDSNLQSATNAPENSLKEIINHKKSTEVSLPLIVDSKKEIPFQPNLPELKLPQERKFPPISIADSVIYMGNELQSFHGTGKLFSDEEIIEKLDIIQRVQLKDDIYAEYTKHGKTIIQQQATRGCTAAVAAMLIMDNGKKTDIDSLIYRNIGKDEHMLEDIRKAGLNPIINDAFTVSQLKKLLQQNGSAIATLTQKLSSHVVVVDGISEDLSQVRLRDPYHGWEITVTDDAFLKEWNRDTVIQVLV